MKLLKSQAGLTLTELLIAMAIFAIIMVPMLIILTGTSSSFSDSERRAELQRRGRLALTAMVDALSDAGCDPTGAGAFEPIPEATAAAITVAADLGGNRPGEMPDGDADDPAEKRGFRLLVGGTLVSEISDSAEPFGRRQLELTDDVRSLTFVYRDAFGEELDYRLLTGDKTENLLARSQVRSLEIRLELAPAEFPEFVPIVLTTTVVPPNLSGLSLAGATGGAFPEGKSADFGGPAVPAENAPAQSPAELAAVGAAANLRDSGVGSPRVIFDSPVDGAAIRLRLPVGAAAEDNDGTVRQVEFYLDDRILAVDGYSPYEAPGGWDPLSGEFAAADGHHLLYALAIDNRSQLGSDALVVEVRGRGGASFYLDTDHAAYVRSEEDLTAAFHVANRGTAPLVVTQLRPAWDNHNLLLSQVLLDGKLLFENTDGSPSGALVPLTEPLSLPSASSGEVSLVFIPRPGASSPRLGGTRIALLAADENGHRWGFAFYLTPTAFRLSNLLVFASTWGERWRDFYQLVRLSIGSQLWSDESYHLTSLPMSYESATWLTTANGDRNKGDGESSLGDDFHGRLDSDNRIHLYLLYDDTATPPLWVRNEYLKSRYTVTTDNPQTERMRVWLGTAEAGTVFFYGNRSAGSSTGIEAMYLLGVGGLFSSGAGSQPQIHN